MAYQMFYGNPFVGGAGEKLAELGREETGFAREVENAKLKLQDRRMDIAAARQRLAESREDRIKRLAYEKIKQSRRQIEQAAAEFEQQHGLRKQQHGLREHQFDFARQSRVNELKDMGFRPFDQNKMQPRENETVMTVDGQQYVGPKASARRAQELEQTRASRAQELEQTRAVEVAEAARQEKNKLRQGGWTPQDKNSPGLLPPMEQRLRDIGYVSPGEYWEARTDQPGGIDDKSTMFKVGDEYYIGPKAQLEEARKIKQSGDFALKDGYTTHKTVDGETWVGQDAAAAAAAKQKAELAKYEAKERIKAKYDDMQSSNEYTPRQKSYLRGLEKDSEGLLDLRDQALKEREEVREQIAEVDARLSNERMTSENLSAAQRKAKERLEARKSELEERLEAVGGGDYDARIEARERVRNAIMENPSEAPPVSLDWLRGVDWPAVSEDPTGMNLFSQILRDANAKQRRASLKKFKQAFSK